MRGKLTGCLGLWRAMGKRRPAVRTGNCPWERRECTARFHRPSAGRRSVPAVIRNMIISFHKIGIYAIPYVVGESDALAHDGGERETTRQSA